MDNGERGRRCTAAEKSEGASYLPPTAVAAGLAANADPQQMHTAVTVLQRLGFVWRPPGQLPPVRYEPGIPSLMAYVLDHAAPSHGEALPETR